MISFFKQHKAEIACFALVSIFFLPLCGFLFRCGCSHLWSTQLKHCNIHNPAPPNCPWCSGPLVLQIVPYVSTCLAAIFGARIGRMNRTQLLLRDVPAGLASAGLIAVLLAWLYARFLNYTPFIF